MLGLALTGHGLLPAVEKRARLQGVPGLPLRESHYFCHQLLVQIMWYVLEE